MKIARTEDRQDAPPAPATPTPSTVDGQVLSFFGVYKFSRIRAAVIGRVETRPPNPEGQGGRRLAAPGGIHDYLCPKDKRADGRPLSGGEGYSA